MINYWSQEAVDQLRAFWADNSLSAGVIAQRLGMSKSAVTSKRKRMKLPARREASPRGGMGPEERRRRARVAEASRRARKRALRPDNGLGNYLRASPSKPLSAPLIAPDAGIPVSILEVTGCRYAVTEGSPHKFCNEPCPENSSWCDFHEAVVWRPRP